MNRGTVILLALAILVAHTFAIHQTSPDGDFAAPYEIAHVVFRLGRNLVYEGAALWNPGGPPVESYPSPLWVLASAVAARLYLSPMAVSQGLGLCAALVAIVVLAQFSPKRTSGLIAPVLMAASGSVAAAALSGTEATLAMLLVTTAFLAFERGWGRTLAASLVLLLLTRPEGLAVILFLMLCETWWRPRGEYARRPPRQGVFLAPLLAVLAVALLRRSLTGQWLSPFAAPLLAVDLGRWSLGAQYLASFVLSSGFGLLFLAVILSLCAARTSAMGARAMGVAGLWWAVVMLSGGDGLPFWNALVPALPLFFLGVQDCLREWMDERESLTRVVWPLLLLSLGAAILASKVPGDIGPLHLKGPLTSWQTPRGELAQAFPRPLGRLGLLEEISSVENLRSLGVFLRQRVGADAVILTSSPGAIGYLSRKEVLDLSGRAWPVSGRARPSSWRGIGRVDMVAALTSEVDYIVPQVGPLAENEAPTGFLQGWLERYDTIGPTPERVREVLAALEGFVLVSVPVPAKSRLPLEPSKRPFPLLQRKELEMIPTLALEVGNGLVRVLARHEGHQQVVDLCVRATKEDGEELFLAPTGHWTSTTPLDARTSLLLFPTGTRSIQLVEARVPKELRGASIATAWLHNPGMSQSAPLAQVGERVSAEL